MFRAISCFLITLSLSACFPIEASPTTFPLVPSETATVTPMPSATIVWFPATATFTPPPTHEVEPTQDLHPALDEVILSDSFTNPDLWQTSRTTVGSIAFGNRELTLAVASERGMLHSLRADAQLDDFYLEIDALPSLCRAEDAYGLLLRASSAIDAYRLLVKCDGQLRMERLKNGEYLVLQDWTTSGQVFPGGMIRVRLGVWALKDELRVYINDVFQFAVRDVVWPAGQVGIFARSAGKNPLTVNFSNLVVYHLDPSGAVPRESTPAPTGTPDGNAPPAGE